MKEGSLDTSKRSEFSCYAPQLCDRKEEANKVQSQVFVPFISVNKESFVDRFHPPDLLSEDASKRHYARYCGRNVAKVMVESNKERIVTNLDNIIKNIPSESLWFSLRIIMIQVTVGLT